MAKKKNEPAKEPYLTGKQKLFAIHYVNTLNATEAARLAGYKGTEGGLAVVGSKNIRNAKIRAKIDELMESMTITKDEVLRRLTEQATADLGEFLILYPDGTFGFNLKRIKQAGHLVKKIKMVPGGRVEVEFHDPQAALLALGRHYKLFTDKIDIAGALELAAKGYVGVSPDDWPGHEDDEAS